MLQGIVLVSLHLLYLFKHQATSISNHTQYNNLMKYMKTHCGYEIKNVSGEITVEKEGDSEGLVFEAHRNLVEMEYIIFSRYFCNCLRYFLLKEHSISNRRIDINKGFNNKGVDYLEYSDEEQKYCYYPLHKDTDHRHVVETQKFNIVANGILPDAEQIPAKNYMEQDSLKFLADILNVNILIIKDEEDIKNISFMSRSNLNLEEVIHKNEPVIFLKNSGNHFELMVPKDNFLPSYQKILSDEKSSPVLLANIDKFIKDDDILTTTSSVNTTP